MKKATRKAAFLFCITWNISAFGQSQPTTTLTTPGKCSVSNTGSNNTITINCGDDKAEGDAFRKIVNRIVVNRLDTKAVLLKLDEIERAQKKNEEQLFQSLQGRLFPANDPTPNGGCDPPPSNDEYIVVINGAGHIFKRFPKKILILNHKDAIWLDKREDGSIALFIDIRDEAGRIAIRLDKDGYAPGQAAKLLPPRRPDRSSLIIQNEYGDDVLSVKELNPQAFEVNGTIGGLGPETGCMHGDFQADEWVDYGPPVH
jgi:hypothetical protein